MKRPEITYNKEMLQGLFSLLGITFEKNLVAEIEFTPQTLRILVREDYYPIDTVEYTYSFREPLEKEKSGATPESSLPRYVNHSSPETELGDSQTPASSPSGVLKKEAVKETRSLGIINRNIPVGKTFSAAYYGTVGNFTAGQDLHKGKHIFVSPTDGKVYEVQV